MHKKLWGIALAGALCLNVVGVAPMQNASVQPAPKTVAPKEVERTFKTAELTEMKYKKVSALPSAAKSVGFTNQESLEDIKRVFGSTQSHTQVSKSIMPGVKKLLQLVDDAIAQFIKSTAIEHKETIKIEFKNEKDLVADDQESFVVDLVFKKIDGKITVAVLISGKLSEDKVGHIRNLLTAILTDDTLWQRYGVKISVGAGIVLVGLVLGKLWLNKRAAATAVEEFAALKTKMTDMAEKIARSISIFRGCVDGVARSEDIGNAGFAVASIVNDVRVVVPLSFDGLAFYLNQSFYVLSQNPKTYLIIPAQIFNGGKKVDSTSRNLLQRQVEAGVQVLVFDEKLVMSIDYELQGDPYWQQYRNQARNVLAEYGLEDGGCWFACAYPCGDGEKGLVGVVEDLGGRWQVCPSYSSDKLGYAISCLLEIPGVSASHAWQNESSGASGYKYRHANTPSFKDCDMCRNIDAVAKIWGLTAFEREDVHVTVPPPPPVPSGVLPFPPLPGMPFPSAFAGSLPQPPLLPTSPMPRRVDVLEEVVAAGWTVQDWCKKLVLQKNAGNLPLCSGDIIAAGDFLASDAKLLKRGSILVGEYKYFMAITGKLKTLPDDVVNTSILVLVGDRFATEVVSSFKTLTSARLALVEQRHSFSIYCPLVVGGTISAAAAAYEINTWLGEINEAN